MDLSNVTRVDVSDRTCMIVEIIVLKRLVVVDIYPAENDRSLAVERLRAAMVEFAAVQKFERATPVEESEVYVESADVHKAESEIDVVTSTV